MRVLLAVGLALALRPPPAGMVLVPAGRFLMGDAAGEHDERPPHPVRLPAFYLDRTEVTVAAYRECVRSARCPAPRLPLGEPTSPVVGVSWRDARAYCRFAGKRLPTEAEWEYAARGTDGRIYPWGNDLDCRHGNFGNYRGEGRCDGHPGRPGPVGLHPSGASPAGALDLAGNVWEWVADRYHPGFYAVSPERAPRGPADGPGASRLRVVRGDGCCSLLGLPRAANRNAWPEDYADEDLGFRCARDAR